jgi:cytochrome P450
MSTDNIRLQDGTEIVKGTSLMISNDSMRDPAFYENPDTFDPYRFVKLRQVSGREHSAHLVAASPEHMGFGYGNHACPGRFFAANEVKIALCHMLLKYEFKLADGTAPQIRKYGIGMQADCMAKLAVRRRREEIYLEDLAD